MPKDFVLKHQGGKAKAEFVKKIHKKVKTQIEKKVESYAKHVNKGRRKVVFEPGDWVWVHLRKERFPSQRKSQRKSKLMLRGDRPFQVLDKINDNAYKIDLPGKYNVSNTFNVSGKKIIIIIVIIKCLGLILRPIPFTSLGLY